MSGLMTIRDWTFILIAVPNKDPLMYVTHNCPTDKVSDTGGNVTRCNRCQLDVPDDIHGLLMMYNWDHPLGLIYE